MFQRIDFTQLGGFPLTQNTMEFIQNSYNSVLGALSRAIGDYVIISGVTDLGGNNYTDGWITFDGQIIPFEGGLGLPNVSVVETTGDETFNDDNVYTVKFTHKAVFSATGIPFSTLNAKRLSLDSLNTYIESVEIIANNAQTTANIAISNGAFPAGAIVIWSGSIASIPSGWVLCNGSNGTPDLRNRFVPGAGGSYTVGAQGGSDSVSLTIAQMPSHNHTITNSGSHSHTLPSGQQFAAWINNEADAGSGSSGNEVSGTPYPTTAIAGDHSHSIGFSGSGQSHENRPPYYALAYIMKT